MTDEPKLEVSRVEHDPSCVTVHFNDGKGETGGMRIHWSRFRSDSVAVSLSLSEHRGGVREALDEYTRKHYTAMCVTRRLLGYGGNNA